MSGKVCSLQWHYCLPIYLDCMYGNYAATCKETENVVRWEWHHYWSLHRRLRQVWFYISWEDLKTWEQWCLCQGIFLHCLQIQNTDISNISICSIPWMILYNNKNTNVIIQYFLPLITSNRPYNKIQCNYVTDLRNKMHIKFAGGVRYNLTENTTCWNCVIVNSGCNKLKIV